MPRKNNIADIVYKGNVITLDKCDTMARAIAVKDGKILYIGSVDGVNSFIDDNTELVDLGQNFIYPGFIEGHAHGTMAANVFAVACDLSSGKTVDDYVNLIAQFIEDNPGRHTYVGNGCILAELKPTCHDLDKISKDAEIYMQTEDGHTVWVNTKVLEKFNKELVEARKKDPETVSVDENGNPNGLVKDAIAVYLYSKIKQPKEAVKQGLLDWQTFIFSQGYTATSDACLIQSEEVQAPECYAELAKEGKFKLRTYASYYIDENLEDPLKEIAIAHKYAKKFNSEYFKIYSTKFFMDGVVEAHTAALIEDYNDTPGNKGQPRITNSHMLADWIAESFKYDLAVHIHSVGDYATKTALAAAIEARELTYNFGQKIILAHLQLIKPEDMDKFGEYQIIACVPPLWVPYYKPYYEMEINYIGKERASHSYPIKSLLESSATLIAHTDYPISPNMSVPNAIFRSITRYNHLFGPETTRWKEEAIDRKNALYMLTRNVAYSFNEEDRMGSLEVGKIANMTVYDTNFLTCPLEEIPQAELINTIIEGKIVY